MKSPDRDAADEILARLKELDAKATPGPWHVDKHDCYIWGPDHQMVADRPHDEFLDAVIRARGVGAKLPISDNMAFIAFARSALPILASELATLRRRVAEMEASETNRIYELQAALALYRTCAAEAFAFIDEDKEMKAMKLLRAMAGELPRYRHDIDKALAVAMFRSPPTRKE